MSAHSPGFTLLTLALLLELGSSARAAAPPTERTLQQRLAATHFALAAGRFDAADPREGLAHLAAALRLDPDQWQARYRLHSFLTRRRYAFPESEWTVSEPSTAQLCPDGKVLLTVNLSHVATLWNPRTGRPIGKPLKLDDQEYSPKFSPGRRFLIARNEAHQVALVDIDTGTPLRKPANIKSVEFSKNDRRAFVELRTPGGSMIRGVWDLSSGAVQELAVPTKEEVKFVHFTQDEEKVVVASRAPEGKQLRVITWPPAAPTKSGHPGVMISTAREPNCISPDGAAIGLSYGPTPLGGESVSLAWSTETGQPVPFQKGMDNWMENQDWRGRSAESWSSGSTAANSEETLMVNTAEDWTAQIWEKHPGSEVSDQDPQAQRPVAVLPHPFALESAVFRSDASIVTMGHPSQDVRLVKVRNWTLASPPSPMEIPGEEESLAFPWPGTKPPVVDPLAFSNAPYHPRRFTARFLPSGAAIAVFNEDGTMRLWQPWRSLALGSVVPIAETPRFSESKFSEAGAVMAIPLEKNRILVWDYAKQQPILPPISRPLSPWEGERFSFALDGDGRRLAATQFDSASNKRSVVIWDTVAQQIVRTLSIDAQTELTLSGDGRRLATDPSQNLDGIVVFDVATGQPLTGPLQTSISPPGVALNRDGAALTLSCDDTGGHSGFGVWFYLANLGQPSIQTGGWYWVRAVSGRANAFSPDGKMLAAAPNNEGLWVYRSENGQPVLGPLRLAGHFNDYIYSTAFSQNGALLATSSEAGILIRDAATGIAVTELLSAQGEVHFDSTEKKFLVAGQKLTYFDLAGSPDDSSADLATLAEGIAAERVNLETDHLEFIDSLPVIAQLRASHPDWWVFQSLQSPGQAPKAKPNEASPARKE